MCENLEGYPKKLAACEAEIRERAGHPLVDSVFNPLALDAADAGRKITTQVKSNGAYDLDNLLTKFVASCQKQALDAEQRHRSLVVASLFLTAICAFVVRRHRMMFQQNPLKGCRTMFAFAGLKIALGILLIRSRPSCSPGCGEYFEICTRQPALFYPVVVFLIALRWIYLGVMFYRKIGTGPLVVALPPLARVVVCDEDEESPQAPTLATWQSTAVWVTLLVLLLLVFYPKHFFYFFVPNGLGELVVYFVVLFWALMVALLCRPTSDARRPEKDGGVDLDRGQPPVAVEVDRVVGPLDDLLERLRPRGHARRPRNPPVKPRASPPPLYVLLLEDKLARRFILVFFSVALISNIIPDLGKTWNHIWFKDMRVNTSTLKRKRFDSYTDDDDIFEHDCEWKNYFTFSVNFPDSPKRYP